MRSSLTGPANGPRKFPWHLGPGSTHTLACTYGDTQFPHIFPFYNPKLGICNHLEIAGCHVTPPPCHVGIQTGPRSKSGVETVTHSSSRPTISKMPMHHCLTVWIRVTGLYCHPLLRQACTVFPFIFSVSPYWSPSSFSLLTPPVSICFAGLA